MKGIRTKVASVALSLVFASSLLIGCEKKVQEQNTTVFNTIKNETAGANMTGTIKELTAEKYNGRLAGSEENKKAAEYIAEYFKKIGLENPKGAENYMQYYTQGTLKMKTKPTLKITDSSKNTVREFNFIDNFFVIIGSYLKVKGESTAQMYYVSSQEELKVLIKN